MFCSQNYYIMHCPFPLSMLMQVSLVYTAVMHCEYVYHCSALNVLMCTLLFSVVFP